MTEFRSAFPQTASMLAGHYKEVTSFHEARSRSTRYLSKCLIVCASLLMIANIGLAWSVASMLPLTKLVPVYLLIRPDGTIDSSVSLSTLPASSNQAVIRAALWQYVQMREGYSYDTAQYRYDIVSGMSDTTTRAGYQSFFNYPNPLSPQVTVGKNGSITVQPISVSLIGPNVAQIRFQESASLGTDEAITTSWTSTLQFQQVNTLPAAQRLTDPAGVMITSYQAEEDTAP